jgi:hypothetical protein
MHSS